MMLHEPVAAPGTGIAFDFSPDELQRSTTCRSIAVIGNSAFSLSNFRGPLIAEMARRGTKVFAFAPDFDAASEALIRSFGAEPVGFALDRTGMHPLRDLADGFGLYRLLRQHRPEATLCYFIKPVIYGSLAARCAGVCRRFALVPGLGYAFIGRSARQQVAGALAFFLYRLAFRVCRNVFFYNDDDARHFAGAIRPDKVVRLNGTGVDLEHFEFAPPPTGPATFLFIGRLLREKGLIEFVDAARHVRRRHREARFIIVGGPDSNPSCVGPGMLDAWRREGVVELIGQVGNVRPWIAASSVFVLPSYREGVSRSTQEAMAMGRPVITTDAPGCRETVTQGVNGFLVPSRDPQALAAAMLHFVANPSLIAPMGAASRRIAEERFDVRRINDEILRVMGAP